MNRRDCTRTGGLWLGVVLTAAVVTGCPSPLPPLPTQDGGPNDVGVAEAGDVGDVTDVADVVDVTDVTDVADVVDACAANTQSDPANCGACGRVCPMVANGTPICGMGGCGVQCNAGFVARAGACAAVAAPRPIAPLSTAHVTNARPTLRWELPMGVESARVQVCADRGCATVEGTLNADPGQTFARLGTVLNPGVHFWRLWGRAGGAESAAPSAAWQFDVPRRPTSVDTSYGSTLDINGDGTADIAVGAQRHATAGAVFVYHGVARTGPAQTPSVTLNATDTTAFGSSMASAGDTNGDGYGDLIVGASGTVVGGGRLGSVHVYRGGPMGLSVTASNELRCVYGGAGSFGFAVSGAGDVNQDGLAYLYLGRDGGFGAPRAISGPTGSLRFGNTVAFVGDLDGDGYVDGAIGAERTTIGSDPEAGSVHLYFGAATDPFTAIGQINSPFGARRYFSSGTSGVGDVNGDGYSDLVVGAYGYNAPGRAALYLGGSSIRSAAPGAPAAVQIDPMLPGGSEFGLVITGGGDVNRDGFADFIIGADFALAAAADLRPGFAYVYSGSSDPTRLAPVILTGPSIGSWFGSAIARTNFGEFFPTLGDRYILRGGLNAACPITTALKPRFASAV